MPNHTPVVKYTKLPDGKVRFVPTVGVARAVFDYVQKHSGCSRKHAIETLIKQGYKKSSVGSLITQNLRAGTFSLDNKNIYCESKEYQPTPTSKKKLVRKLKSPKEVKAVKAPKADKPKANAGIAALKVDASVLGTQGFEPKEFLNTLSIIQARALYDELKQVFGVF